MTVKECCAAAMNKMHDHCKIIETQTTNRLKYKVTSELIFGLTEALLYIDRPVPNVPGAVRRIREALEFLDGIRPGK